MFLTSPSVTEFPSKCVIEQSYVKICMFLFIAVMWYFLIAIPFRLIIRYCKFSLQNKTPNSNKWNNGKHKDMMEIKRFGWLWPLIKHMPLMHFQHQMCSLSFFPWYFIEAEVMKLSSTNQSGPLCTHWCVKVFQRKNGCMHRIKTVS